MSRASGIRISSVINLTDELVAEGVLELKEIDHPRSSMKFTAGRWFAVVGSIAADRMEFAKVGLDGSVQSYSRHAVEPGLSVSAIQAELMDGLTSVRAVSTERCFGIGVAVSGIVDTEKGLWHSAIHLPSVHMVPLADNLKQALNCPVLVENDVRASLWGALWFEPQLETLRNVVYLSLCSGIGSALLIDGRLYKGARFWAGEMGHMRAGDEGRLCCCGKMDCLETYCSVPALASDLIRVMPALGKSPTPLQIADAIVKNPVAANVADRAMAMLGRQIGSLSAYVDPDAILLGEQEQALYDAILPSLRRHIQAEFQGRGTIDLPITLVKSPEHASLRGIAAMVIDEAFRNTLSPMFRDNPVFTRGGDRRLPQEGK